MTDQVTLSGDLSITGEENTYTTLFPASGKRHFLITSGTPTFTLEWLNVTGGSYGNHGGSIYINVGGHLNITHCVFYKSSAVFSGGAIYANDNMMF